MVSLDLFLFYEFGLTSLTNVQSFAQAVDKPQTISQMKLSLGFRLRRIYYISDAQCEMRIAQYALRFLSQLFLNSARFKLNFAKNFSAFMPIRASAS